MGDVRCKRTDDGGSDDRNSSVMWCSAKCGVETPRREEARIRGRETSLIYGVIMTVSEVIKSLIWNRDVQCVDTKLCEKSLSVLGTLAIRSPYLPTAGPSHRAQKILLASKMALLRTCERRINLGQNYSYIWLHCPDLVGCRRSR